VGFYSQVVFPRLCDLLLSQPTIAAHRCALLACAGGQVLEIGFGTGLNLPHYPAGVASLTAVDPNGAMHHLARRRIRKAAFPVQPCVLSGERLPFDADSFDCVVSTFTLCSIEDVEQALAEARRVLKPGGTLLFLEHGLSPQPWVQKWQRRLNGLQRRLGDGCRLDRDIKDLVTRYFGTVEVEEGYLARAPRTHGYLYRGVARK
jgi:ubiquinone/menaquinone biosynthesis C-methylase UbiE